MNESIRKHNGNIVGANIPVYVSPSPQAPDIVVKYLHVRLATGPMSLHCQGANLNPPGYSVYKFRFQRNTGFSLVGLMSREHARSR